MEVAYTNNTVVMENNTTKWWLFQTDKKINLLSDKCPRNDGPIDVITLGNGDREWLNGGVVIRQEINKKLYDVHNFCVNGVWRQNLTPYEYYKYTRKTEKYVYVDPYGEYGSPHTKF